jgi:hypothetical protein
MRPLSHSAPSSSAHQHVPEDARPVDRELLIDIDFFDAQGRWNPTHVVFCPAEDQARAKSLWTRCFRGFMALHGKLWAKNYLSSHFENKPESKALLEQIKRSGIVDNKIFRKTVAQCTLLYEDLGQVATGKVVGENRIVPASPIKDLEKIVSQHFLHIRWDEWKAESDFKRITLPAAQNIKNLIQKLKVDESNDHLIDELSNLMDRYQTWVDGLTEKHNATEENPSRITTAVADYRATDINYICTIITDQIESYRDQREAQEPIKALLDAIDKKKDYWISKERFNTSFVGHLEASGLVDYLKRGNAGFIEEADLSVAERILKLTSDQLRRQADFLSDQEFALLQKRFEKLKKELPMIKAVIQSVEAGAAKVSPPISI